MSDDLVKRLREHAALLVDCKDKSLHLEAADALERRWVPVIERLPEPANAVLVFCSYGPEPEPEIELGEYRHGEWRLIGEDWDITVTHWMPLPSPPAKREGE